MHSTVIAVDLAKDVFELAIADRHGRIFENHRLTRAQFTRFIGGSGGYPSRATAT